MADQTAENNSEAKQSETENTKSQEPKLDLSEKGPIINNLRRRSFWLKFTAVLSLVLVLALMSLGGYGIFFVDLEFQSDVGANLNIDPGVIVLKKLENTANSLKNDAKNLATQSGKANALALEVGPKLNAERSNITDNLTELKSTHVKLNGEKEIAKNNKLRNESKLESLRSRIIDFDRDRSRLKQYVSQSKRELARAEEIYEKFRRNIAALLERKNSLNSRSGNGEEIRDIEKEIEKSERNEVEYNREISILKSNVVKNESEMNDLDAEIEKVESQFLLIEEKLTNFQQEESKILNDINVVKLRIETLEKTTEERNQRLAAAEQDRASKVVSLKNISAEVGAIRAGIDATRTQITSLVADTRDQMSKIQNNIGAGITSSALSTLITRAAILFILLFVVQVLVSLYRYNMRLAGFYDARADALSIFVEGTAPTLGDLMRSLSPEQLDFGKTPTSVAQQSIELAKSLVSRK